MDMKDWRASENKFREEMGGSTCFNETGWWCAREQHAELARYAAALKAGALDRHIPETRARRPTPAPLIAAWVGSPCDGVVGPAWDYPCPWPPLSSHAHTVLSTSSKRETEGRKVKRSTYTQVCGGA